MVWIRVDLLDLEGLYIIIILLLVMVLEMFLSMGVLLQDLWILMNLSMVIFQVGWLWWVWVMCCLSVVMVWFRVKYIMKYVIVSKVYILNGLVSSWLLIWQVVLVSLLILIMQVSEVFFIIIMNWFIMFGIMLNSVCGRIILCSVVQYFMFSVCVVFVWLCGRVWMLVLMILFRQVFLQIISVISIIRLVLMFLLNSIGMVKYDQNISSSSGRLCIVLVYSLVRCDIRWIGEVWLMLISIVSGNDSSRVVVVRIRVMVSLFSGLCGYLLISRIRLQLCRILSMLVFCVVEVVVGVSVGFYDEL